MLLRSSFDDIEMSVEVCNTFARIVAHFTLCNHAAPMFIKIVQQLSTIVHCLCSFLGDVVALCLWMFNFIVVHIIIVITESVQGGRCDRGLRDVVRRLQTSQHILHSSLLDYSYTLCLAYKYKIAFSFRPVTSQPHGRLE